MVLSVVSVVACDSGALSWTDATAVSSPLAIAEPPASAVSDSLVPSANGAELALVRDLMHEANAGTTLAAILSAMPESRVDALPALRPVSVAMPSASPLGQSDEPLDSAACPRSVRIALAAGRGRVAAWWSQRARGRVWLLAAWRDTVVMSASFSAWRGPIVVDSLDRGASTLDTSFDGANGCERAAPSVAVDDKYGYVHVGYALTGPEGPGVFYAHQMDPRSAFEPPVAIVYGESPSVVRVAAQDDVVAVAYEDPNSGMRSRIAVAISLTSGHTFAERAAVSGGVVTSRDPFVVVRGRALVVGWTESPTAAGTGAFRTKRAIVRR